MYGVELLFILNLVGILYIKLAFVTVSTSIQLVPFILPSIIKSVGYEPSEFINIV